jgi:hypothetical protein
MRSSDAAQTPIVPCKNNGHLGIKVLTISCSPLLVSPLYMKKVLETLVLYVCMGEHSMLCKHLMSIPRY